MANIRVQVNSTWSDGLPRDTVVNVLHFLVASPGDVLAGYQDLVDDVAAAFNAFGPYSTRVLTVKAYNLADTKPRPILATKVISGSGAISGLGNRDVALCLSFYADRNIPRHRGRIYLGPFSASDCGTTKPGGSLMSQALTLANALGAAGPTEAQWSVWSELDNLARPVTKAYVDNEWDTQRRRGLKSDARTTATITA